jgi:hypothetical protein
MMNEYEYTYSKKNMEEYDMDKIISKKIMHHLNSFFTKEMDMDNRLEHAVVVNGSSAKNSSPTKVRRRRRNNKTKKIRYD